MNKSRKFRYKDYRGIGCIIGHRDCIPKVKQPLVPKIMGWLWTAKDTPGLEYDPDWRPGAIRKNALKKKQRKSKDQESANFVEIVRKLKRKKKGHFVASVQEGQEEEEKFEPAFTVRKRDGNIHVTIQPIKADPDRHVSEYPYEDKEPFHLKVENQTQSQINLTTRKKEREEKRNKIETCALALDEICNDVYQYINHFEFNELAAKHQECPCAYLQSELLKYLVYSYIQSKSNQNKSKTSVESEKLIPADLIDNLIECFVDGENPDDQDDDFSSVDSNSGRWSIEFNPPVAKWDPEVTKNSSHKKDRSTQFGEAEANEALEVIQKGGKRKTLYINPNFKHLY